MPKTALETDWEIAQAFPETSEKVAQALNIPSPIAQLLLNRGIKSLSEAHSFLKPDGNLSAPSIQNESFHTACQLIQQACKNQSLIYIVGDYDVDGVCSSVIFKNFIEALGGTATIRIPDRLSEGYGLGQHIVEEIIHTQPGLLLTLDCGISNKKEFDTLNQQCKCKSIIFDHHQLPPHLPAATCILNAKCEKPEHPHFHLCAAGLVYCFIYFFKKHYQPDLEITEMLNLATLATVADIVPLIGDNRKIVFQGQRQIQQTQCVGLRALLDVSHIHKEVISSRDIGFGLGPRINAAGRLKNAKLSINLLLAKSREIAYQLASEIDTINTQRKSLCETTFLEAKALIQDHDLPLIALAKEAWHAGVIGITASQLMRSYHKPCIMMAIQGKLARGSARSIPSVNIYEILKSCKEYFESFGGHHQAAGFSILEKNIPAFLKQLKQIAYAQISPEKLIQRIKIDYSLAPQFINLDFIDALERLEPFGIENPEPIFYCRDLRLLDYRLLGKQQQHLKLSLSSQNYCFEAIGFNLAHLVDYCHKPRIQCVFKLQRNIFNGIETAQLEIIDIK